MTENLYDIVFVDNRGRNIRIKVDDPCIRAYDKEKEIGEFYIENDDGPLLHTVDIEEGYQRAGIGSRMLQMAFAYFGILNMPNPNPMENRDNRISTEGAGLINHGIRNGWVKAYVYPFEHQEEESEDDQ